MERPKCYEFAMEFVGDPEETEVRQYIEWLEQQRDTLQARLDKLEIPEEGE